MHTTEKAFRDFSFHHPYRAQKQRLSRRLGVDRRDDAAFVSRLRPRLVRLVPFQAKVAFGRCRFGQISFTPSSTGQSNALQESS
jgi:hypothetical protein